MTKPSLRVQLPEEWWLEKDDVQFAWLDAQAGGKLEGSRESCSECQWASIMCIGTMVAGRLVCGLTPRDRRNGEHETDRHGTEQHRFAPAR